MGGRRRLSIRRCADSLAALEEVMVRSEAVKSGLSMNGVEEGVYPSLARVLAFDRGCQRPRNPRLDPR